MQPVAILASPLTACLTIVDLYRQRLSDPTWQHVWDLIWDRIPYSSRNRVQSIAHLVEIIEYPGIDSHSWRGGTRGAIWLEVLARMQVPADFHDPSDGDSRVWNAVREWLEPHVVEGGIWGWQLRGLSIRTAPSVRFDRDERGRLHNESRAAVEYEDGFTVHAWHGARVPPDVILKPQEITADRINREPNAEVRHVLVERFGAERYIRECGAQEVARDAYGILYRKDFRDDEPLAFVCVQNSTPDVDGHRKSYWLRVSPRCRTPHEAVAWTFGMTPEEYDPEVET